MTERANPTVQRIQQLLRQRGIDTAVVEFPQSTRTSKEAAAAIGCEVAQIAKSIVFRGVTSGVAVVVIASGVNRVSESKVADLIGEPIAKADADFVRERTGYVIGGVAPFGHRAETKILLDEALTRFAEIWAAAGTPNAVFRLTAAQLQYLTGARFAGVSLEA